MSLEDPVLFGSRQTREERKDLCGREAKLTDGFSSIANLSLSATEHKDVARSFAHQLFDRVSDGDRLIARYSFCAVIQGSISHLDREAAT